MTVPSFILYGHDYCHLCELMVEQLQPLVDAGRMALRVLDLDDHPELESLHAERVPVLIHEDGEPVCHGRLDLVALERALLR